MEKREIERLLAARKATEEYERDLPLRGEEAELEFIKKLQDLEFNSPKEFYVWNGEMNLLAFKEYRPIFGDCDLCEGYDGTPPCFFFGFQDSDDYIWQDAKCYQGKSDEEQKQEFLKFKKNRSMMVSRDFLHATLFRLMRTGKMKVYMDKERAAKRGFCPEGHGYYVIPEKMRDLPFDIHWERGDLWRV